MNAVRFWRRGLGALMLAVAAVSARGQLVLSNFSTNHPIKIMAMGDSITDDCEVNGAWRQYLQPLLQSNGIPFGFTGRNTSITTKTFTQVHHEGYCGAVIAAPGEFAVYGYGQSQNYLENIVVDALAVTNNRPDLMLILIGANDNGYGRSPYRTVTNDMSILLKLIFAKDSNTCVILSRITSLQSASLLGFGNYASNVPIYNANLIVLVNERQAAGQKVYLSDMYSAVNYSTMFNADHVHPNTNGLAAMAQEWMSRIQAIVTRTNQMTTNLIHAGDFWTYFDGGQDLGTNWPQAGYDDSSWNIGLGRLGYGEQTDATTVSYGSDATNMIPTTYFRKWFAVPDNIGFTNLNLRVSCSDGAAVYLNGSEIYRTNLPSGTIARTNLALGAVTGYSTPIYYQTNVAIGGLLSGSNLLAVEVHKSGVTNAVFGFDAELFATGFIMPPPAISAISAAANIVLTWPAANSVNYALHSTADLSLNGTWALDASAPQTNGGQISVSISPSGGAKFFRLQHP
ncbi:MAG TPA: GDSL-type esterase/lipase family protein [Verrucomicrobiae bacterium]|jgi:lysophospholipase L1-like esterase